MDLPSKYDSKISEEKWYSYWLEHGYFYSKPDQRPPYTIVIPPPNVTGVLHMGHMLNNTIQDVLIRRARMQGYNACWVPGTDHASIATEAKVVNKLKAEGKDKMAIGRDAFLEAAWEWTHKYGGVILEQLKKLGCSCDWSRTKFTMEKDLSDSVTKVFVDLYNKGLIYRGYRMVNWDPEAKTTLSDEEVNYVEQQGTLYRIAYTLADSKEAVTVATTRPETIFGDVAICVNPEDRRYIHLVGKHALVPISNRKIPIIADSYVDMSFGTGCLKITPAHDVNDQLIGEKHHLEIIDIFDDEAKLNHHALHYEGQGRFEARAAIVRELEALGQLVGKEPHIHKVGTSERTGAVIEPKMSVQWFLKMETLSKPALKAVLENEIEFVPAKLKNTYRHWMEQIRDWNISRQLWWGHRIPAYFYDNHHFVVAETTDEALELAKKQSGNPQLRLSDLKQDTDVLDTWFSSWLWPISVFNGILSPDNEEIKYYYPTKDLVTAPEIIFFWVARMIIAGYEYRDERPFEKVYFTGIVRDKQRRKMSKSLGNSPEPLDLIAEYGADGVRVGMLLASPAGNDLMFDEDLCKQGSAFSNKIWNAFRLIQGWKNAEERSQPKSTTIGIAWFRSKLAQDLEQINNGFERYKLSEALMITYKLIRDEFCSWLLEVVKPPYGEAMDKKTFSEITELFEDLLKILHPFMPFISEDIWQRLQSRTPSQALVIASWPSIPVSDNRLLADFEYVKEVITGVRSIRKDQNIAFKETLDLICVEAEKAQTTPFDEVIKKLCNLREIHRLPSYENDGSLSFRILSNEYFLPIAQNKASSDEETRKKEAELGYAEGFLKSIQAKLSNEKFVQNAPAKVLDLERQKEADTLAKIANLKVALKRD